MTFRAAPYVYISGPLQAAEDLAAARRFYERIAKVCREAGWEAYLPHQESDPITHADLPAAAVFERDYKRVREAALIVAYVGPPSSGVGAELGIALERGVPVIALCRNDERPSRFVAGMIENAGFTEIVFEREADCATKLAAALVPLDELRKRSSHRLGDLALGGSRPST